MCDIEHNNLSLKRYFLRKEKEREQKKILAIRKRLDELYLKQKEMPLLPLPKPIQRGFIRYFILREDITSSKYAAFYQEILTLVNTTKVHYSRHFKQKKRRQGKRIYVVKGQELKELSECFFLSKKNPLSEKQKALFIKIENSNNTCVTYRFSEPWRFVLTVKPNLYTHYQAKDTIIESQISEIENIFTKDQIWQKYTKIKYGYANYKYRRSESLYKMTKNNYYKHKAKNLKNFIEEYEH